MKKSLILWTILVSLSVVVNTPMEVKSDVYKGMTLQKISEIPNEFGIKNHATSYAGDVIFILGGTNDNSEPYFLDTMYEFNPTKSQCYLLDNKLPYKISQIEANFIDGKVYIAPSVGPTYNGGWGQHKKVIEIDSELKQAQEMNAGYEHNVWGALCEADNNGNVYFFGGHDGSDQNFVYKLVHRFKNYEPKNGNLVMLFFINK